MQCLILYFDLIDAAFEWNKYLMVRNAEEVPDDFFHHVNNYLLCAINITLNIITVLTGL